MRMLKLRVMLIYTAHVRQVLWFSFQAKVEKERKTLELLQNPDVSVQHLCVFHNPLYFYKNWLDGPRVEVSL